MKGYSKLMKKALVKILALTLSMLLCVGVICGCASSGKAFMKLEGESMSVNMYRLYLSRMKGTLASSYAYGAAAKTSAFWDTVMSADGTTYNDYFTAQILENTKTYLAALVMFEEEGLKLPDEYIEEIDSEMQRLLDEEADGSKNTLNSLLAPYGVNYKMLREAYIIEAKIAYLYDHIFGESGSKIAPELVEDYYQKNYVRFKQVFIPNYELLYEEDEFGNVVWYRTDDKTRIAYDTTAEQKKNEDGSVARDKNNDIIFVNEQGEIAYTKDKTNATRVPLMGEDGEQKTRPYTEEELIANEDTAKMIMEKLEPKNFDLFDACTTSEYNLDEGAFEYPNGYYMLTTSENDYLPKAIREELLDMETGEIRKVYVEDSGIHIIMKYELDEGAYTTTDDKEKLFFRASSGNYLFLEDLKGEILEEMLKPYKEKIVIDEGLIEGIDIKSAGVNFYY